MSAAFVLSAQTIAPKKCNTCGKPLAQCQYKGRHPKPVASEKPAKQGAQVSTPVQPSKPTSGYQNGHEWVDLGLPSGTKWATMNVGASSPSDYGSYFAWGETSPKSTYTRANLKYCVDTTGDKFSKYVIDSEYGNVDGKRELELSDDAAYVNWGSGWRMPSKVQLYELREKCKWTWTTMGGHNGYKVVGPNGNSIFLPAAGYRYEGSLSSAGSFGDYWSRSLNTSNGWYAYSLFFDSSDVSWSNFDRSFGHSVRPVLGT
ncbi:MAG: hypothetical protein KBT06_05905 [Prevotellaceae bacterium]|nr:hypothetical protein [Candidatus Colivivens equi]